MSDGVNNNNEISLNSLQKKLVNLEKTTFEDESGVMSVFNAYNTDHEENDNQIERLDKKELQAIVNDIKEFDGKGGKKDNVIDAKEAEIFVNDFNTKHPDKKIKASDIFKFVEKIYNRYDYYNSNHIGLIASKNTVGEPLSEKTITMKVFDEKSQQYQEVQISVKLYATKNKQAPQQYVYEVLKGKEFCTSLANDYGYKGEKPFMAFIQHSLGKPDPNNYDVNFQPRYATTRNSDLEKINSVEPEMKADGVEDDVIVVPRGFDKDPKLLLVQYKDPKVQQTIQEFKDFLKQSLRDSRQTFEENLDSYGFTEKFADFISHAWNNDKVQLTGNTKENIDELLKKASVLLDKMDKTDNSLESIINHEDFSTYYKELTGVEFNPKKLQSFLDMRKEYLPKEAAIITHNYVHGHFTDAVDSFVFAYNAKNNQNTNTYNAELLAVQQDYNIVANQTVDMMYKKAYEKLFNMFNGFLGVTRENWDKMFAEFEKRNINPAEFMKNFSDNIIKTVDKNTKQILNIGDLSKIESYQESLRGTYSSWSKAALGKEGNLMEKVSSYHNSQVIGGIAVYAVTQLALYSTGLAILGHIGKLTSGVTSGLSYAGSYLTVETASRLSNGIDDSKDLWNMNSMLKLLVNTGAEFAAGYLFDGILKTKYFGKYEKAALTAEAKNTDVLSADLAKKIGQQFLETPGVKFDKEFIKQLLGVRGMAAVIGSTKDGTKEFFKETCKSEYSLSDIGTAFVVGAISNALFIRFKNSGFAKSDHKIAGKFFEKSPKGTFKQEQKGPNSVNSTVTEEQTHFEQLVEDIKNEVITQLRENAKSNPENSKEINNFLEKHSQELNDIIMNYFIIEYLLPED